MRFIKVLAVLALIPIHSAVAQKDNFVWGPAPGVFAPGAKMAVLQGDPGKAELFTVRLDLPDGYKIAPHFHPTDENVTVISGTFLVGMGDKLDAGAASMLRAGGFVTAGANMHHFAIARGHTVVQVHAMGPFVLTYVNPSDMPAANNKR
jgi:quercetin dioxygenase-like cupin family protein